MKRILNLFILLLVLLTGCGKGKIEERVLNKTQGRLLVCNNDTYVMVVDGSPVVLNLDDVSDPETLINYSDGDLVEVWHDMVLTSYPGQTKAHKIVLIEEGDISDVDEDAVAGLSELGWLTLNEGNLNKTQGRLLICNNEAYMLIHDEQPMVIDVRDIDNISDCSDGDLIDVWHDAVQESYPSQTKAVKITLVEEGNMADVDENVARQLCDMGWIEYDDMVNRYQQSGYILDCETADTEE